MNIYRTLLLNILRMVGALFSLGSALIMVESLIDLLRGIGLGATWLTVFVSIIFIAIGILIMWVTTVALRPGRLSSPDM
jgi:hypothetical protein